jgi:transcriptional regulator with XRE-family HTH domain
MPQFDGALLRARREQLGLTVEELSALTKVTDYRPGRRRTPSATVTDYESGVIRPSVVNLGRLCRALECDPSALFSGDEDDADDDRPTDLGEATDRWIAETLASAPPMTERQRAAISAIFWPPWRPRD